MKTDNKKTFYLILVFLLFFISLKQAAVTKKQRETIKDESIIKISYEIIEDSNTIFEMQDRLSQLRAKNESFSSNLQDKNKLIDDINSKISSYKAINGYDEVSGRGIEIKAEGNMITEEVVDLVNGIRNTKPRAISLNDKRVVYNSYFVVKDGKLEFDGSKIDFPVMIKVIGDPDILRRSLDRPGGILDVLKKNSFDKISFSIENKDNMVMPPFSGGITLKYSKVLSK